jgi:hypothetical protein
MRTKIQELKNTGLSVVNLYNYWLDPAIGSTSVPLPLYVGVHGAERLHPRFGHGVGREADYRKALAKITMAPFTCFDAEMQPFSAEKPTPEVRTSTRFPYASSAVLFCMLVTWPLERRRGTRSPTICPRSLGRSPRR